MAVVCNWSLICFEHKVEFADCSIFTVFASTSRAVDVCVDESFHFIVSHCINWFSRIYIWISSNEVFNKFVCAVTCITFNTVNHRVREVINVTRSLPSCMMLEDSRIKTNYIVVQLSHVVPPFVLNISLEFYTEWTVVPGTCLSTIDF